MIAVTTRSVPFSPLPFSSWVLGGIDNRRCAEALQAVSSWAVSSLYLPKTASSPAGLVTLGLFVHPSNQSGAGASARLVATEATHSSYLCVAPPGQSPAYTYLKQPWQPLQVFALSQSLFCLLLQPALGYTHLKQHLQPLQIFNQKI